jgi:HlyD family secretion protein
MKRTQLIALVSVLVIAGGFWIYRRATHEEAPAYRFAVIERGDLESAVSATGTLNAVTTVQVGTQVSGKIVSILADFNDPVKKGQLIARIDPTLLEQSVRDAQAGLERAKAQQEQSQVEFDRNRQLFERKVLTEIEFNNAKYALAVARANVKSAQVTLDRARQNLAYTSIYAPIDGVVVERSVDVGQTVAASLSAPQLFLIANDLSQMQILASVDESDIGQIKEGQPVRFTVQAYPNQTFSGVVKKVRLQSKTTENVVNYTVVVGVDNKDNRLLPGMTATAEFLTGSATNVLTVANAAVRFRPTQEMIAEVRAKRAERQGERPGMGAAQAQNNTGPRNGNFAGQAGEFRLREGGNGQRRPRDMTMLWYLDENGELAVTRARTGITDGQRTEIRGPEIKEGMQVIIGVTQTESSTNTNPLQPQGPMGGPTIRRGPGF